MCSFRADPAYLGAWCRVELAGREAIVREGRNLIEAHRGAPVSPPHRDFHELTEFPPAIRSLRPRWVRVYSDSVVIMLFGLGDAAGWVIRAEEVDDGSVALSWFQS